jgi:hypothetical protein
MINGHQKKFNKNSNRLYIYFNKEPIFNK